MARHAGFAAALALGQSTMQRLVNTLYAANKLPHLLPVHQQVPWAGGTTLVVDGSLFCGQPQIRFLAAAADQFTVELRCWGTLRFAFPQEFWEGPFEITATALVAPTVSLEPIVIPDEHGDLINVIALQLGLDAPTAQVTGVAFRPLRDRQPSPDVQTVLNTPALPTLLTAAVRALLTDQAPASIPLRFLGGLQLSPAITAKFRIVD